MKLVFCCLVAVIYSAGATTTVTTCSKEDLKYEYTTCDHNGGRWKVQVPTEPEKCTITNPKPPTRGKSCDFTCKSGQYLDMETEDCKPCVAGTYSLGGGERFEEWDLLPPGFKVSVESLGSFFIEEEDNINCSSSLWTPRGNYISSLAQSCSSSLTYSVTLVKAGSIEFEYQYPSSDTMFHFIVQNSQCQSYGSHTGSQFLEETEEGKWSKKKVHLTSGSNVLVWKTLSLLSESSTKTSRNKPVLIRKVEINGVAFTSKCSKCKNGTYSSEGAAYCSICNRNTYSLKGQATCTGCDQKSEYSERGASSCLKRPACTNKDYYEVQAPCDQNKKTRKLYKWLEPQICRTDLSGAVNLPDPSPPEDCPPCNPGMHFVEGKGCEFCSDDMYSDGAKSCQACPASTSPNIGLEYKWWNQMPANMSANCITFSDSNCSTNASWVLAGDHIRTQFGRNKDSYLVLIFRIPGFRGEESSSNDITVGTIDFQFQLSCGGNCELIFLSDEYGSNGIVKSWTGEQKKQQYRHEIKDTQPLTLTWAFQSSEESDGKEDVARIYSVKVTNTLTGGAKDCQKCMRGVKNNQCISCPAGHYVDLNNTQCLPCPNNAVIRTRLAWGEDSCIKCGPGLRAKGGTSCVTDCVYTDESNRKYDFTALKSPQFVKGAKLFTGSGTGYFHGFNISLCAAENTKALCQNNMTAKSEKSENFVHSMVCRSAMVPTKKNNIVSSQPVSIGDYLTKILSNQTHESDLHDLYTQGGIPTEGMERDVHFFYKTDEKTQACPKGRKTIVSLKCDQQKKGQGVIEIPAKCPDGTCDGCLFHFLWTTDQACPPCVEEDIQIIVGECLDEVQTVHYSAPKYCRPDKNMKNKEQRKCRLKLAALPFVLKVGIPSAVGVGILLFLCVIYCWCRNRKLEYKYMKLVEGSGPNYDGELPGVDSCALEDGEDEHFDTVSFSETKKKGLFSKLRGKKYKSHDDNPFETSHTEKLPLT